MSKTCFSGIKRENYFRMSFLFFFFFFFVVVVVFLSVSVRTAHAQPALDIPQTNGEK